MKKALITGITGQDGSYLAEFLIEKGYEVHGIIRRSSSFNTARIEHLYLNEALEDMHKTRKVYLHYGDMTDSEALIRLIRQIQPDEIYNLACPASPPKYQKNPIHTIKTCTIGLMNILDLARKNNSKIHYFV